MPYATYDYYAETYGGTLVPISAFTRLERRARAVVDQATFCRIRAPDEAVKQAVCALCDLYYDEETRGQISSENNDGYSVTYAKGRSLQSRTCELLTAYLAPTGLLYGGMS